MAFNDLLAGEGSGVVWMVEVVNAAGTVQYRYASGEVRYSGNDYDGRIVSLGTIERTFSVDHLPAAGSCELVLDNTDNGADWLANRSTVASVVFSCRFKVYLALWDSSAAYDASVSATRRLMGEYVALDFPRRDSTGVVRVALVDDSLGRAADLAIAPTIQEWSDSGTGFASCPVKSSFGPDKVGDWNKPVPLVFGREPIKPFIPVVSWHGSGINATQRDTTNLVICATVDSGFDQFVTGLTLGLSEAAQKILGCKRLPIPVQGSIYTQPGGDPVVVTLWAPSRSELITKGGRDWYILYVSVQRANLNAWLAKYTSAVYARDPLVLTVANELHVDETTIDWEVEGYPFSAISGGASPSAHPVDVIKDLLVYYAYNTAISVDTTQFAAVKGTISGLEVSGIVEPVRDAKATVGEKLEPWNSSALRKALGDICASADLDLFQGWDGSFKLTTARSTFASQTDTLTTLREEVAVEVDEHVPSVGERWAPYNRVLVETKDGEQLGPYDNADGISDWGRILTRTISAKWTSIKSVGTYSPWQTRQLESVVRPVLKVVAPIEVLQFDLGDLLTFSWTRGVGSGGTPYDGSCFKVEGISVDTRSNRCTVTLVWQGDLRDASNYPFLLDSETLITRVSSGGGRTATVQNSSTTVTFSSGSLISDGVAAGDFLILEDATLAEDNFSRFRALLIASITDATHLVISDSDLNFNAASPTAVSTWSIRKSHATYPTAVSDPTNYPSGAVVYGKVATDAGTYTDSGTSDANRLLDG